MTRIRVITDEMRHLQELKNEALRMKLRGDVAAETFRDVTVEIDAADDQLAREHSRLASEAAMPELPGPVAGVGGERVNVYVSGVVLVTEPRGRRRRHFPLEAPNKFAITGGTDAYDESHGEIVELQNSTNDRVLHIEL